jgi:hypothetical protein
MTQINVGLNRRASRSTGRPGVLVGATDGGAAMNRARKRNRLTPWYIGLVINLAAVLFVGYRMWVGGCPAPTLIEIGVLTVIPAVYLALMYLTFVSQE